MLDQARAPTGLAIDGYLPLSDLTLALADDLGRLAPFGAGNPPLTLVAGRLRVLTGRKIGRNEEHRLLLVADEAGNERQVIWWDGGSETQPEGLFDWPTSPAPARTGARGSFRWNGSTLVPARERDRGQG